jgi:hypothetical protein
MQNLPKDSTLALLQFYSRFSDTAIQRCRCNEDDFEGILHERVGQVSARSMKVSDFQESLTSRRAPRPAA